MKLREILLISLVILLGLLTNCASVPDVPVCVALSEEEGYCTYTMSNRDLIVNNGARYFLEHDGTKLSWDDIKVKSLIMPASSYAKIKAYFLKQCKRHGDCAKDLGKWKRKADRLDP